MYIIIAWLSQMSELETFQILRQRLLLSTLRVEENVIKIVGSQIQEKKDLFPIVTSIFLTALNVPQHFFPLF